MYRNQLGLEFFEQSCLDISPQLLGCIIVSERDGLFVSARITETEAYPLNDPAHHSYPNKITPRTKVLFDGPGHLYEYLIMGLYTITSLVVGKKGSAEVSFIRSVEPLEGIDIMRKRRNYKGNDITRLASGPGLLSQALGLTTKDSGLYICNKDSEIRIYKPEIQNFDIEIGARINIGKSRAVNEEEAIRSINQPWRYYIKGSRFLS